MYAAQLDDTDKQVMQLQETMNEVFNVTAETDASDPISKENFALTYDTAFASVGTDEFEEISGQIIFNNKVGGCDINVLTGVVPAYSSFTITWRLIFCRSTRRKCRHAILNLHIPSSDSMP